LLARDQLRRAEGVSYYGEYAIALRNVTIEDRASVFEENVFTFNRKHHIYAGAQPPPGFRAVWPERDRLAVAKLYPKVQAGVAEDEFPTILMEARRSEADCDFIEVHMYGPVYRAGIERVRGPVPGRGADRILWNQCKRKLVELGAHVEEIS
jgi:hypothetical protein